MQTKLQTYQEIQGLVQKEAKTIAENVYKQMASQYNINKPPVHYHDGVDLPRLELKNIIQNVKYNTFLVSDTSETFTLKTFPNLSTIKFYGFAADNAGGGAATKRASLQGEAQFGTCYIFTGTGGFIDLASSKVGIPFIQGGNAIYVDAANQRVTSSNADMLQVADNTGTVVVRMTVINYFRDSVTFQVTLAPTWKLQGTLIIT